MTAETDLLPCPWCGEKLASVSVSEGSTFRWRKVDGCCADGPEVRHNTMADDQEASEVESRTAAIAAWNTRANLAELQREVEGLRDLAERRRILLAEVTGAGMADRARAERLAGALRGIETKLVHSMDHAKSSLERKRAMSDCADAARAALDQETTNG